MSVMERQRPRAKSARKLCSDSGNKVRKAEASHSESISGAKEFGTEVILKLDRSRMVSSSVRLCRYNASCSTSTPNCFNCCSGGMPWPARFTEVPEGIGGEPVIAVHDLSRSGRAILAGLRELANLLHGVLHQGMKFIAEKQIVIDDSGKHVGMKKFVAKLILQVAGSLDDARVGNLAEILEEFYLIDQSRHLHQQVFGIAAEHGKIEAVQNLQNVV